MKSTLIEDLNQWFIDAAENPQGPYVQPWGSQGLVLPRKWDGQPYKGSNVFALVMQSMRRGYTSPYFLSFKKAKELGGHVRKGASSCQTVYFDTISKTGTNDNGEDVDKTFRLLKYFNVFSADQVDGLPERFYRKPDPIRDTEPERNAWAEEYLDNCKIETRWGGDRAYYSPSGKFIQMPMRALFNDAASLNTTRYHETFHAIEEPLGLKFSDRKYGDHNYALLEMAAEWSATMWAAKYGLEQAPAYDHAAYVAGWAKKVAPALRANNRAFMTAASFAQRAVDHTDGLQPQPVAASGPEVQI